MSLLKTILDSTTSYENLDSLNSSYYGSEKGNDVDMERKATTAPDLEIDLLVTHNNTRDLSTTTVTTMTTVATTVTDEAATEARNEAANEDITTAALQTLELELDRTNNLSHDTEQLTTEYSFHILPETRATEFEPSRINAFTETSEYHVTSSQWTDDMTSLRSNKTASLISETGDILDSRDFGSSVSLAAWIGVGSALSLILLACLAILVVVVVQKIKCYRARKRRLESLNGKVLLRLQLSSLMAKDQLQSPQTACVRLTDDDGPSRRASYLQRGSERSRRRSNSPRGDRLSRRSSSVKDDRPDRERRELRRLSSSKAEPDRLSMIESSGTQNLRAPIVAPEQIDEDLAASEDSIHEPTSGCIVPPHEPTIGCIVPPHEPTIGRIVPPHEPTIGCIVPPHEPTIGCIVPPHEPTIGCIVPPHEPSNGRTVKQTQLLSPNCHESKELYEKDSDTDSIHVEDYPAFVVNNESFKNIDDDNDDE